MTARFLIGDVFDRMAELEDGSFDMILTSPPFLALRSYLPDGHPDKAKEIGSESTPAEFLDTLLALTAVWRRLLAPHGSLVVELGDTYAGSGGAGGDYNPDGLRDGQERFNGAAAKARAHATKERNRTPGPGWPLDKSLTGIPTLYTWSLAYGRNLLRQPLTARELLAEAERIVAFVAESSIPISVPELLDHLRRFLDRHEELRRGPGVEIEPWRIRNLKPWIRSNPPVGALGDKERPATSYITVATLARDRWFDLDAVRTAHVTDDATTRARVRGLKDEGYGGRASTNAASNPAGAPPLDWVHTVDLILDTELDTRNAVAGRSNGGKTSDGKFANGPPGSRWLPAQGTVMPGARGHHLRRALEAAGILTTLDAIDVSPKGYAGAHYAVWPPQLCRILIDEMCPRHVCTQCGQPRRRITKNGLALDRQPELAAHIKEQREALGVTAAEINEWFGYKEIAKNWERTDPHGARIPNPDDWAVLKQRLDLSDEFDQVVLDRWPDYIPQGDAARQNAEAYAQGSQGQYGGAQSMRHGRATKVNESLGWSDCGHNTWRPGHILDPFGGSGTTGLVATGMGRDCTLIDLDERNADLCRERVGMFLEVIDRTEEGVA